MPTIKDSSSIEEVLQYIVACYGAEIYQEKQRLSNLIADLYTGEERLKRLYRRMVMEDTVSQQLYAISLKPIQEREVFYNRLVHQFKEANFYEEAFARQVLDVFLHGMNLLLVEPISTKATIEDGEWYDEYGVMYSADRKKLIRAPERLCGYRVLDGTVVICDKAFWGWCKNLKEINIPSSVTSIGDEAFSGCSNLQEITLPSGVTSIGNSTFWSCSNLRKIALPPSITSIGDEAFYQCKNLQEITLPSSVTSIGDKAFSCCLHLQEITLPSSVTSIGRRAFTYCSNLREINTAESNKVYRAIDGVLYTKDLKTIIRYPVGKEDKKFVIPSGITSIGDEAFWGCSNLQEINIPSSVTSIGNNAFYNCSNLQEINVAESNKVYRAIDGVLYTKDLKTIIRYPVGKMNRNFVIPSGVTSIGDKAFIECENLHEITLPSGVMSIGDGAFWVCRSLETITLPPSVTSIGNNAFYNCSNLQEITIPSSVTSIGKWIFSGCWNLKEINVAESNKFYRTIDGVLYTKDLKTIICYPQGKEDVKFVIPSGVTSVGDDAFISCWNLQEITLPSSITSIGDFAFFDCDYLQEITLPSSVTSIGDNVFKWCKNLHRINIPAGTLEKFKELLPRWTDKLHEV